MAVTYVGELFSIKCEILGTINVKRCALGVDDELGMVSARDREALHQRRFISPPKGGNSHRLHTVWYERNRPDWKEDQTDPDDGRFWFHDVDAGASVTVSRAKVPRVFFDAPDVSICPQSGAFLCG
jgi:hypothetical protein